MAAVVKSGRVSKPRGQQCLSQALKKVRHIKLKMVIETLPTRKGHNHYFEESRGKNKWMQGRGRMRLKEEE